MVRVFMYYFWKYIPLLYILLSYSLFILVCMMDAQALGHIITKAMFISISFVMTIAFYNMAVSMWKNR